MRCSHPLTFVLLVLSLSWPLAVSGQSGAPPPPVQDEGEVGSDGYRDCDGSQISAPEAGKQLSRNYTWVCPNGCSWGSCGHGGCGQKWLCNDADSSSGAGASPPTGSAAPGSATPGGTAPEATPPAAGPGDPPVEPPTDEEPLREEPPVRQITMPPLIIEVPPPGGEPDPPFDKMDPSANESPQQDMDAAPGEEGSGQGISGEGESQEPSLWKEVKNSAQIVGEEIVGGVKDAALGLPRLGEKIGETVYDAQASGDFLEYLVNNSQLGDRLWEISQIPRDQWVDRATDALIEFATDRYDLSTERGWLRLTGDVENLLSLGLGGGATAASKAGSGVAVGRTFGLGKAVANPGIKISGFSKHGINQVVSRGVSPQALMHTMRNPTVVLEQAAGSKFLYISNQAAVVVDRAGTVVTSYPSRMFDSRVKQVLQAAGSN